MTCGSWRAALRFFIRNGIIVIPKTSRPERMAENLNVFKCTLYGQDTAQITGLDTGRSITLCMPPGVCS
jgi:2,5-diketo-D-gluconate reductase A